MLRFTFLLPILMVPGVLTGQFTDWDTDQDGMPNGWEFYRGLNVEDPKDAWQDPDGDSIYNIYEYFLGSDPQDPSQPAYLEVEPGQPLEEYIKNAPRGVVLRLRGGAYQMNYQYQNPDEPPRLLIQGGWNNDFSNRDDCRHPTVLISKTGAPLFDMNIFSGNSAALLLDGITLKGATSGAIRYTGYLSKAQLLLGNCFFTENSAHRASSIIHFEDGESTLISDLIVVNTVVAGNMGTGISVTQHANRTNFKILHSLIAFNDLSGNDVEPFLSGYGIKFSPNSDSLLNIQLANSIFWGNTSGDIQMTKKEGQIIRLESKHNIYEFLVDGNAGIFFSGPSNRSIDPLLRRAENGAFFLDTHSPALNGGMDIGLSNTAAPDVGHQACINALTTTREQALSYPIGQWRLYPNPAGAQLFVETSFLRPSGLRLIIRDHQGRILNKYPQGIQAAGKQKFSLPTHHLAPGWYFVECRTDWGWEAKGFIKLP